MKKRWMRLPLTYAKDREATTFYALALNMASPASDFGEFPLAPVTVLLFGVETEIATWNEFAAARAASLRR